MQQYLELLKIIQEKGTYKPAARENMPGTQSLFGYQFRHDLSTGFPALTTKKIFWKGVVVELLWFLRGDTNIKYLVDNGVNFWNEDAYNFYNKECKNQKVNSPLSFEVFVDIIKNSDKGYNELKYPEILGNIDNFIPKNYVLGDCGYQYGKIWRNWEKMLPGNEHHPEYKAPVDQIKNLINSLKNNPESRRHIVSAIDPAHDTDLALYWCHAMFQFNCRPLTFEERKNLIPKNTPNFLSHEDFDCVKIPKYYLDCQLFQRSADAFLGVTFNIASYSLLTEILAKICNMIPGEFIHSFGDCHIYDNHKDAVSEQLQRAPTALPKLIINDEFWNPENVLFKDITELSSQSLTDFISSWEINDFQLENYNPQSSIKAELSTGMKK